ncbi:hypothetical protein TSUD_248380 [Trifolium subterraneum]|uniref:Uncharacterized protein n=1 Tax=Trifolium subterraneum TaxID=3900 RepID=A0A2Z6MIJ6_TRISU|nr:hypothetical protein TSUD_248380 [Trifolium subterraneum]
MLISKQGSRAELARKGLRSHMENIFVRESLLVPFDLEIMQMDIWTHRRQLTIDEENEKAEKLKIESQKKEDELKEKKAERQTKEDELKGKEVEVLKKEHDLKEKEVEVLNKEKEVELKEKDGQVGKLTELKRLRKCGSRKLKVRKQQPENKVLEA